MHSITGIFILLSVTINIALGIKSGILREHLWNNFKKTYGREYFSEEHHQLRQQIFNNNLDLIEKHNNEYSMGMHTYTLAMNEFADWTPKEFAHRMLGTRRNMTHDKSASAGTFIKLPASVKIESSVDWRQRGAVTPVKNQGQCGSCWAFSTTGSLEAAHYRLTGDLVSLSEQQLVDCSGKFSNEGCNGGLMDNAFQYIKSNGGIDTEESYPYHAHVERCHYKKNKIGSTCSGFVDIESGDEDALRDALATVGPVSVAIDATQEKFMFYNGGIFVDDTCNNGQEDLDHGVLVVGYGTNSTLDGKTMDYWLVKNSWGTRWGEDGYIRMARNLNNMCGIASSASYPLVKKDY